MRDGARGLQRLIVDLLERQRRGELLRGLEEALGLVLGALDGAEHALGLDDEHDLLGGLAQELLVAVGKRARFAAIGAQHAAHVAVLDHRHAQERAYRLGALVVRYAHVARLEPHGSAAAQDGAGRARARRERRLGEKVGVGDHLLDLQPAVRARPAVVVEPEQHAGAQLERLLEQLEQVVEAVVDGLDGALGELLLLLGSAAGAAAGAERGADEAEVARLLAQRAHGLVQAPAVLAALAPELGAKQQRPAGREGGEQRGVPRQQRRRASRLEGERERERRADDRHPLGGGDEGGAAVDDRVERAQRAAGEPERGVGADHQQERRLELGAQIETAQAQAREKPLGEQRAEARRGKRARRARRRENAVRDEPPEERDAAGAAPAPGETAGIRSEGAEPHARLTIIRTGTRSRPAAPGRARRAPRARSCADRHAALALRAA